MPMDDASWQNKCGGSTWQPPLLQRSKSYFESSLTMQHQRFALNGGIPEPLFLNNLNGGFYKTDDSELLSSFLDVPSVPSSLVKYDNNQPISLAGELPNSSCVVIHSPAKGAVPQMNLPLSANLGNGNDKSGCFPSSFVSSKSLGFDNRRVGAGTSPVFSTRELFSNDYKRATVTCNDLRTSNINLTSLELGRAIDHQFVPGFEIEMQISSPLNELSAFNQANIGVLQSTNSQQLDKSSLSADTSTCNQTNTFVSACPRVYCLSKSGNLFLSHTGLLALFACVILCKCLSQNFVSIQDCLPLTQGKLSTWIME